MSPKATQVRPDPFDAPTVESDEAKPHQHGMAQAQGKEYKRALTHMAETVAEVGVEAHAGDMIIALAIEKAEGMYVKQNGHLTWMKPSGDNAHLEISARDSADQRFIPGLTVNVSVTDGSGDMLVDETLPMLWHPWLYHYGANMTLPEGEPLTVEVEIGAPDFPRHDEKNGKRYATDVYVRFDEVELDLT
ncbi:MAG: iron transporter [Acidimicrobiia bacterium]